jgi:hypothetical protein
MDMRLFTVGPFYSPFDLRKYRNDHWGLIILIPRKMRTLLRRVIAANGSLGGISGHLIIVHGSTVEMGPTLISKRPMPPVRVPKGLSLYVEQQKPGGLIFPYSPSVESVRGTERNILEGLDPDLFAREAVERFGLEKEETP